MDNLNVFQKTRIILLVLIIIALIVLGISAVKTKKTRNYSAKETFAEIKEVTNDVAKEVLSEPTVSTDPGDTQENEDTSWDEQDVEETKVDTENEENSEENNKASFYLKINYTANVVTAYKKDKTGKYTVPVRAMVCSTGTATPTSGVYKMSEKYRWHQLNGGVYGQYCSRITGHILFHSVPYAKNTPDSLKYVAYDKLGTKASAGCIRLTVADAMWVYNNCASGTYVEFYSSSDPGPLGKPTAQKISSNEKCRNWDPTDPTTGNPWHTYTESSSTKVEDSKTETNNNKSEQKSSTSSQSTTVNTKTETTNQATQENKSQENQTAENTQDNKTEETGTTKEEQTENNINDDSKQERNETKEETKTENKVEDKKESDSKTDNTEKDSDTTGE